MTSSKKASTGTTQKEVSQIQRPDFLFTAHHDELRTKLYNPDEEAFSNPIEIRRLDLERNKNGH